MPEDSTVKVRTIVTNGRLVRNMSSIYLSRGHRITEEVRKRYPDLLKGDGPYTITGEDPRYEELERYVSACISTLAKEQMKQKIKEKFDRIREKWATVVPDPSKPGIEEIPIPYDERHIEIEVDGDSEMYRDSFVEMDGDIAAGKGVLRIIRDPAERDRKMKQMEQEMLEEVNNDGGTVHQTREVAGSAFVVGVRSRRLMDEETRVTVKNVKDIGSPVESVPLRDEELEEIRRRRQKELEDRITAARRRA